MTAVEVMFRYGMPPGEKEMSALGQLNDVYGIRRVRFNEAERTIRVEYDATRLNESTVENLLRDSRLRHPREAGAGLRPRNTKGEALLRSVSPFALTCVAGSLRTDP